MHRRGLLLLEAKSYEEAIARFNELLLRFENAASPEIQGYAIRSLCDKGIASRDSGRLAESGTAFDRALSLMGEPPPDTLRTMAASAWLNLAVTRERGGRPKEAALCLEEVFKLLGDPVEPEQRGLVARALFNMGTLLLRGGALGRAIELFDEIARRFEADNMPTVCEQIANALVNEGAALLADRRPAEALEIFEEAVKRYSDTANPALRMAAATGLGNRARILAESGHANEAFRAVDEFLNRYPLAEYAALLQTAVEALYDYGLALANARQTEEAAAAFDALISHCTGIDDSRISELVWSAWQVKGLMLKQCARTQEAMAAFNQVAEGLKCDPSEFACLLTANALSEKALIISEGGDPQTALRVLDKAAAAVGVEPGAVLLSTASTILLNKAVMFSALDRGHEALAAFTQTFKLLKDASSPRCRIVAAKALFNRAAIFVSGHFAEKAVAACRELVNRFGNDSDSAMQEMVSKAEEVIANPRRGIDIICDTTAALDVRTLLLAREKRVRSMIEIVPLAAEDETAPDVSKSCGVPAEHAETNRFERDLTACLEREYRRRLLPPVIFAAIGAGLFALGLVRVRWWHIGRILSVAAAAGFSGYSYRKLRVAWAVKEYLDVQRKQVRELADRAALLHQRAAEILAECREKNSAFALFLRNFDVEAYEQTFQPLLTKAGIKERLRFHLTNRGQVEMEIAAALAGWLPIIGVANPVVQRPDYQHAIPKLELPADRWRETLDELVAGASLIVMDLERLSPGVSVELETILRRGKQNQTVVILSRASRHPESDPFIANILSYYQVQPEPWEPLQRENPALASFQRVAYEEEVPFDDLEHSPVVAGGANGVRLEDAPSSHARMRSAEPPSNA